MPSTTAATGPSRTSLRMTSSPANPTAEYSPILEIMSALPSTVWETATRSIDSRLPVLKFGSICCGRISPVDRTSSIVPQKPNDVARIAPSVRGSALRRIRLSRGGSDAGWAGAVVGGVCCACAVAPQHTTRAAAACPASQLASLLGLRGPIVDDPGATPFAFADPVP